MKNVTVRDAEPKDAANYVDWLKASADINLVDLPVYTYPTCHTLTVEKAGEPILMNSFQSCLVMEALAPKPGISPMTEAKALKVLFDGIRLIADSQGVREVMFGCKDARLEKFILSRGFEKLSFPVYRIKL